jgi:hypothetical protein
MSSASFCRSTLPTALSTCLPSPLALPPADSTPPRTFACPRMPCAADRQARPRPFPEDPQDGNAQLDRPFHRGSHLVLEHCLASCGVFGQAVTVSTSCVSSGARRRVDISSGTGRAMPCGGDSSPSNFVAVRRNWKRHCPLRTMVDDTRPCEPSTGGWVSYIWSRSFSCPA